jgi:hypothetical protein
MQKNLNSHLSDDQLNRYLDGFLDAEEAALIDKHLMSCESCNIDFERLKSVFQEIDSFEELPLMKDLSGSVVETIQRKGSGSKQIHWGVYVQLVFAIIILVLAVPTLLRSWLPLINQLGIFISEEYSRFWIMLVQQWSTQVARFRVSLPVDVLEFRLPINIEVTQAVIWSIFVAAILLFIIGNLVVLRNTVQNEK